MLGEVHVVSGSGRMCTSFSIAPNRFSDRQSMPPRRSQGGVSSDLVPRSRNLAEAISSQKRSEKMDGRGGSPGACALCPGIWHLASGICHAGTHMLCANRVKPSAVGKGCTTTRPLKKNVSVSRASVGTSTGLNSHSRCRDTILRALIKGLSFCRQQKQPCCSGHPTVMASAGNMATAEKKDKGTHIGYLYRLTTPYMRCRTPGWLSRPGICHSSCEPGSRRSASCTDRQLPM
ncbi:hypothetical protein GGR57DRAFT_253720 [Xylariaceae sp. FL1272]|nr:hypothetical protein GGR57DRAFT_253720 [Xylariaceae sp. FL1272]